MQRKGVWIGLGLIVAAIVVPLVLVLTLVMPQFRIDERVVPVDGSPHSVTLPSGTEYALLAETRTTSGTPSCLVIGEDGAPIPLRATSGSVTVNNLMVLRTFDTGDGEVVVTCQPAPGYTEVALGRYPKMALLLTGIFGAFGFALVFGGLGVTLLVLALVRRKR
ncbi:hypothetical protein GCM10027289_18350 [Tsukamurella serpentis]